MEIYVKIKGIDSAIRSAKKRKLLSMIKRARTSKDICPDCATKKPNSKPDTHKNTIIERGDLQHNTDKFSRKNLYSTENLPPQKRPYNFEVLKVVLEKTSTMNISVFDTTILYSKNA